MYSLNKNEYINKKISAVKPTTPACAYACKSCVSLTLVLKLPEDTSCCVQGDAFHVCVWFI